MGMEGYVQGSTKQREQLVEWMVPEFSSPSAGLRRWGWRELNCIFSLVPSNLALHSSLLCSVPQEQPLGCTNGLPDLLDSVLGWGKRKEPGNIFPGFPLFQVQGQQPSLTARMSRAIPCSCAYEPRGGCDSLHWILSEQEALSLLVDFP